MAFDLEDSKRRMDGALKALHNEFAGLRTGRASAGLLDPVQVEAYGNLVPLSQVATINVPDARLISVQVWDRGMCGAVEKAILNAGLGLNPSSDGQNVRVPIPPLSEERRKELVKVASKYAEAAKVAIRNIRRDGMDTLKKLEKDGELSQDEQKRFSDKLQTTTDDFVVKVDEALSGKEKDILKV